MTKTDDPVDEDDELFQVVNVTVMSSPDAADCKGLYAAETENLDPVSLLSWFKIVPNDPLLLFKR